MLQHTRVRAVVAVVFVVEVVDSVQQGRHRSLRLVLHVSKLSLIQSLYSEV
jgi:hypothetical protein